MTKRYEYLGAVLGSIKGYKYLGAVWGSPADCEEIELEVYMEKLYNFAMLRLKDSPDDWREKVALYKQKLLKQARARRGYQWEEVIFIK